MRRPRPGLTLRLTKFDTESLGSWTRTLVPGHLDAAGKKRNGTISPPELATIRDTKSAKGGENLGASFRVRT